MGTIRVVGDTDSIGWRIVLDMVINAATFSHEVEAFIVCLLKAA